MPLRAPHLHHTLRCFCLGAFGFLSRELEDGAELPFSFEEHASLGRPALYEYRPLVRPFVDERRERLERRDDARLAVAELLREPEAGIFARAHSSHGHDDSRALLDSVLMPLLVRTAESCGGFDWEDEAFEQAYAELEAALFGDCHRFVAVTPLVGLSAGAAVDLGAGIRVRPAAPGELASAWPEANGLLPPDFGREPDRTCVLELVHTLERGADQLPDAPGELADGVTAIRLATDGAVAAGPVIFERLDRRPYGIRPAVPIAGTQPRGEPARLDPFRGRLARDLRERLVLADDDPELGEALDRWELSLFQAEPFCSEQLRESLAALLGGADGLWAAALRAAVLLGDGGRERAELHGRLRGVALGEPADDHAADAVRRALVETLVHGDRPGLMDALDETLLGLRPRPAGYFARLAASGPRGAIVAA